MNKRKSIFIAVVFVVSLAMFFCPKTTKATSDSIPPQATVFSITPSEINTELSDQTLTLHVTLTDNMAGVCISGDCGSYNSSPTQLRLRPTSGGSQFVDFYNFTRTSGSDLDGTYTATAIVRRGAANGVWEVENFLLGDKLGNYTNLCKADLENTFGSGSAEVNNIASTSDTPDTAAPELVSFDFNPKSIDVSSGSQAVEFTIHLTDPSGVKKETYFAFKADNGVENGYDDTYIQSLYMAQLVSGDDKDGIYKITVNFPENSAVGNWRPYYLLLWDGNGNIKTISGEDVISYFESKGFPTVLEVKKSTYIFGGFLPPVAKDGKAFNKNSTIPVKFQLTDASGEYVSDAKASLMADEKEAVSSGNSNDGNEFRYDELADQYVFNLSLKKTSLEAEMHTLKIILDDGTNYSQDIMIK